MDKFINIVSVLEKWENNGKKIITNGARLICPVPHVAAKAWLHLIYAGLTDAKITELQNKLDKIMPRDYIDFLKNANGINIFSDSISIWGLRNSYIRVGDEAIQPYDVVALNAEKTREMPDSWFLFGSYSWDGSTMVYDLSKDSSKVYLCECNSARVLKEWPDFWCWLKIEVERLSQMFDEKGIEYDEDAPTIPTYQMIAKD